MHARTLCPDASMSEQIGIVCRAKCRDGFHVPRLAKVWLQGVVLGGGWGGGVKGVSARSVPPCLCAHARSRGCACARVRKRMRVCVCINVFVYVWNDAV